MNNPLENLRQLTEAVRMAGADIAPTYIEYVQLAFAIANDCGEAGRNDFLSLCSLSSKYDEKNAQALFSNALHADKEDIHLGTVFHLAGQCGVKISGSAGSHKAGTMGTAGTAPFFLTHTCARIKPGSALVIRSPYRPHSSDPLLGEPFEPPFPGGRFSSPFSPRCVYEGLHAGGLPGAVCCVICFFYCKR